MRLGNQRASHNVEDRRGMEMVGGGLNVGGILIAQIGVDPGAMVDWPAEEDPGPRGA